MNSNLACGLTSKLTIFRSIVTKLGRRHVINASDIKNYRLFKKKNDKSNTIAIFSEAHSFT